MLGVCINYFVHGCDQVSDKKQLKGGRLYLSSGFEYYIMVGKSWQQETGGRNTRLLARIWANQEAELGYRPPGLKPCP